MVGLAGAQTAVPARLTLDDALKIAAERNPRFAAARNAVEAAEADRLGASTRPNPALSVSSEGYPIGQPSRSSFWNGQQFTIRYDQEIETGGRRGLRSEATSFGVNRAQAVMRDQLRQLELEVRRAYFQVVLAAADRAVATDALAEIDRVISLNRARFTQGEISGGELRRLQVERLKFVDDVFAAELASRNAKSALLALFNSTDLATPFDVAATLGPTSTESGPAATAAVSTTPTPPAADVTGLRATALTNRPDLLAAKSEEARADTQTRLQRALRTPNVTAGGGYQRDFGTNSVAFGVTVPLPIFNRNPGGIARAEAERRRAANEAAAVQVDVLLDVQQAVNAVEVNRERVGYIERDYLRNARESRDIVLASYRLGSADLINFLDAQRAFRDTLRTYNRALFDLRLSEFLLQAAVGTTTTGQP